MTRDAEAQSYHGAHLRRWREYRQLTQSDLSRTICTQASLSNYELGKRDMPLTVAVGLAKRLRLTLPQMLDSVPPWRYE